MKLGSNHGKGSPDLVIDDISNDQPGKSDMGEDTSGRSLGKRRPHGVGGRRNETGNP